MFTGIIEATAHVLSREGDTLILEKPSQFDDIKVGSSIAVAGVCLSVVQFDDASMTFNIVDETYQKTSLASLEKGSVVNLERAMLASARLDGHIVQGHVEGTGIVVAVIPLTIDIPETLLSGVTEKGSIAIDGVSLTVASLQQSECTIALIPHTLKNTTLSSLQKGDSVNIETDILVRQAGNTASLYT